MPSRNQLLIGFSLLAFLLVSAAVILKYIGRQQFLQPNAAPPPAPVSGIIAVKEYKGKSFSDSVYQNPNVSAVALRIGWNYLEPQPNQFSWDILDSLFEKAAASGKYVGLIITPGFDTPAWALSGVKTVSMSRKYGTGRGSVEPLPLPWDSTYLDRWYDFLSQVSNRYGSNSAFRFIAAAGPTSVSAEMSLPNTDSDIQEWISRGYTPTLYINAWAQTFAKYHLLFPKQYFSLALYPGLPINDQNRQDRAARRSTRQAVIEAGLAYPSQFALQTSGLNPAKGNANGEGGYEIVKSYSGRIVTGFQMSSSHDSVKDLRQSADKGLAANIKYLQIYEKDILNPSMQQVLRNVQAELISFDVLSGT